MTVLLLDMAFVLFFYQVSRVSVITHFITQCLISRQLLFCLNTLTFAYLCLIRFSS